jgi:DNA sulfur modification protein DndD
MSEEIRILEIETENYRQYGGINTLTFSEDEKGFAVIIGENGAGKSNILNAINWCFYKKEPHQKKNQGKIIINDNYLKNLEIGHDGKMSVKIKLKIGGDEYHISRILTITRGEFEYDETNDGRRQKIETVNGYLLPAGCEVSVARSTFVIQRKKSNEKEFHVLDSVSPYVKMQEILPESLGSYFLLDGEYLEHFWSELSSIKIAITQISQLHILESASGHIEDMKKRVPQVGSQEIDALTAAINQMQYEIDSKDGKGNEDFSDEMRWNYDPEVHKNETYHASGKFRIEELTEDVRRMKTDLLEISKKFQQSGAEVVVQLEKEQEKGKENFTRFNNQLGDAKKQYITSQISNGTLFLLLPAISEAVAIVDDLRIKGELPYEAKKIFTNDLLERDQCICGINLVSKIDGQGKETNSYRKKVEIIRDSMEEDQGLDVGVNMKYHFEEIILSDKDRFLKRAFDEPKKKYSQMREAVKKQRDKNREIMIKLQTVGVRDVSTLAKDQEALLEKISDLEKNIKDEEYEVKRKLKAIGDCKIDRNKKLSRNIKTKKIAYEQKIWDKVSKVIETAFSELREDIRKNVAKETFKIFTEIMYKDDDAFKRFSINEKYEAELIDKEDAAVTGSISAGESLFLSLAFISALKQITGYKFPLVIDTPLGKVSGKPRYLLSKALPKYLPNEQLIFLATNSEFLDPITNWDDDPEGHPEVPFGKMLEDELKQGKIKYDRIFQKDGNTTVIPYQPKWRKDK